MPDEEKREDRAALEKQLREKTAQLEAVSKEFEQFSHSVSHDLRAPLRALEGFAQILVEDYSAKFDEEGKRCIEVLSASARKATLLLDDLLVLSRLFRKPYAPCWMAMGPVVERRVEELKGEMGAAKVSIEKLPQGWADATLIGQVWTTLLENALKFSRPRPEPKIEIFGKDEPERVVYGVRDNGVGFEPKYSGRLFGIFQRLHGDNEFPGRGIGLAVVKRILNRHGGEVWAEGRPNEGATFYFALPKP